MKLACDLCGGTLQMNSGGQDATCTDCGLVYPLSRLHEKLDGRNKQGKTTQKTEKPVRKKTAAFVPEQFVMENNGTGVGDLSGRVKHGGIGLGDKIYIDGDYDHPYTVNCINDNPYMTCAKEGMPAELFLVKCPKKILRNARRITGDPNPVANAYNYPGTVAEYFTYVLQENFPRYDLREKVPCEGLTIPANFMLFEGSKPVAAVFVVGSNDCKARYQAEKAARVLGTRGIASTHFFEDYRNDAPYVTKRVQEALQATAGAPSAAQTEGEPVVLEVLSKKNRPGMAWGTAKCRIRQGKVESGAPYYGHINSLTGQQIRLGSMTYDDATEGGEVTMLLYCDKTLLASIKTLYVFPVGEYDDGDVD